MSISDNHRGGVVRANLPPGAKFALVPRAVLEDQRLGLAARAVASWLGSHSEGWQIAIPPMRRRLGLSEFRWLSIARELEVAGYLTRARTRPEGARGQWVWDIVFDHERGLAQAARDANAKFLMDGELTDGELTHGKPRDKEEDKGLKTKTEKEKRERTRERVGVGDARPNQGTAPPAGAGGKTTAAPELSTQGIWFRPGDPRDESALARIRGFEPGAVAAAVAEILATEPTAWPGQVLAALLKVRTGGRGSRPEHAPAPPPVELTPGQLEAQAAARATAAEKLSKLQKKMVAGK